jgi:hypothetical protein
MVKYTLYTETKDNLTDLISKYFKGATINNTNIGLWEGKKESCTKIELIIEETLQNSIKLESLISDIKAVNEQESVLLTKECPLIWWL